MQFNILVIEDEDDDFLILEETLCDFKDQFKLIRCRDMDESIQRISEEDVDACLVDYYLGKNTGLDFVHEAVKLGFKGPLILLTGADGNEGVDEKALKAGADDYLSKSDLSPQLIRRTLRYNLQRKRTEIRHRASEAEHRQLAEISSSALHNIGNVLNSVLVAAESLNTLVQRIDFARLISVADLLENHGLLADHPKAALVPNYLRDFSHASNNVTGLMADEVKRISERVRAAGQAINVQQNTMRSRGEHYRLFELFEEAIAIQRTKIIQEDIEWTISGENHTCCYNRSALLHIMINLVKNAVEAMRGGREKRLNLSADKVEGDLHIKVKDSGHGMSPETIQNLFRYQFTTKPNGNVLGLHFCKQTLERAGASIAVASKEDVGTQFTICLPSKYLP
jgi:signal transduction histidine kinase